MYIGRTRVEYPNGEEMLMTLRNVYVFLTLMIIGGILAACQDSDDGKENEEEKIVPVETAEVEKGDLTITKSVYGRLEPSSTTPAILPNPGEIDTLEVAEGDHVNEDDTIATIVSPAGEESVRAESDGMITNLDVEEGDMVSDDDPLAVIADVDTMTITFNVTAQVRSLFAKDDEHQTVIEDDEYDATIQKINEMPDDTGLYPVEANVENDDDNILSGMIARMDVPEKKVKDTLIVPTSAVVTEDGDTFVFIVDGEKAEKIDITVTETQSDQTAIEGDVEPEDEVITDGQMTLVDGSKIDVTEEENAS